MLGYGIKGAVNTYTNTGGDFGLLGFAFFGGLLGSTNQLYFSGGESASTYLTKNHYDIEVGNGTDKFLQLITPVTFSYINIIGGIEYGISQSAGVILNSFFPNSAFFCFTSVGVCSLDSRDSTALEELE